MSIEKKSLKECVKKLSEKNTDYKFPEQAINQAESLKSLSNDLYTDNIRFIYELIQNADDAKAKKITIVILNKEYLIIGHDGKWFDEKDLQGLCGINNGTKKKDLDKTGYKGLGFKAVFGKSEKVIIYSYGEYFRFDSSYKIQWNKQWGTNDQQTWETENGRQFIYPWQINPIWTTEDEIPEFIKNFLHKTKKTIKIANVIELKSTNEVCLAINQLKQLPHTFIFLRNISQITFLTESNDTISIACDENYGLRKIYLNENIISQWITKRFPLDIPDNVRDKLKEDSKVPDKLRSMEKTEIFFAAKYTNECIIEKLKDKESHIFTYLPTKIFQYTFPLLINANFLTNTNREQIHTDSIWNQWLFHKIGNEIFRWIKELIISDRFGSQAYQLIPLRLNLTDDDLSKQFNNSLDITLKNDEFILNRKNEFLRVDEVIMDKTSMSKQSLFINIDSMHEYIIDQYKDNHFKLSKYPFIDYDSNLEQIGVKQFTWQNCIEMFKSDIFSKKHSIENNQKMIEYFYENYSNNNRNDHKDIQIEQIPFLMDQNNCLQSYNNIYFPSKTIDDNEINDSDDLFLNNIIFDWLNKEPQKGIKEWLQKLGISEQSHLKYLEKRILPNVATYMTSENAMKTIKILFMLFEDNLISKKVFNQLKQLKLLTTRGTLISAGQCFFSDEYNPRLKLEEYLKTNEDKFLTFNYVKNNTDQIENEVLAEWRRFFSMLGVQEELYIINIPEKITESQAIKHGFVSSYLQDIFRKNYNHQINGYSDLQTISYMQHTDNNHNFAKFFWSYVFKNIKRERFIEHIRVHGNNADQRSPTYGRLISNADYIRWFTNNVRCIPTTFNTCESANKMFVDTKEMKELCGTYMPFLSIEIPYDKTSWYNFLNFKTKFMVEDYFILLEKIRKDENELKNNIHRIQMIYSQILDQINSWSREEQITLRARTKKTYLLTVNNKWILSSNIHIYIEDNQINNNLKDIIPCLQLDPTNKKHTNLQKFLDLFYIKTLNMKDLKWDHTKSSPADEFQKKLIEIIPFLKTWLIHENLSNDVTSNLIDKIIEKEIQFFESDRLQLYYNEKFIQKTNVYHDIVHQKLYITRPWTSETTLRTLPKMLCQLLNILGFENNLRFLLRAEKDEIINHFKDLSIEILPHKDIIPSESPPKTEVVKQLITIQSLSTLSQTSGPSSSSSSSSVKDKEASVDKNVKNSQIIETINEVENRKSTVDSTNHVKHGSNGSWRRRQTSLHETIEEEIPKVNKVIRSLSSFHIESNNEKYDYIQLIDVSSISTSTSILSNYPQIQFHNRNEGTDNSDLLTGFIGEYIVYQYLFNQYRHQSNSVSVIWENKNEESYLPYDILLTKNEEKHYIEVKSTRTHNQNSFPLSIHQIKFILQNSKNYFIYRVYIDEKKLHILDKIQWRLEHKQHLSCYLTIE